VRFEIESFTRGLGECGRYASEGDARMQRTIMRRLVDHEPEATRRCPAHFGLMRPNFSEFEICILTLIYIDDILCT
jgi:hypothetical protein